MKIYAKKAVYDLSAYSVPEKRSDLLSGSRFQVPNNELIRLNLDIRLFSLNPASTRLKQLLFRSGGMADKKYGGGVLFLPEGRQPSKERWD